MYSACLKIKMPMRRHMPGQTDGSAGVSVGSMSVWPRARTRLIENILDSTWSWTFHHSHSLAKCKQLPKINRHWHLESFVMSQKDKQENILFCCVCLFVVFWPGRKRNKFVNSGSPSKLFTLQSPFICCSCQRIHSSATNLWWEQASC